MKKTALIVLPLFILWGCRGSAAPAKTSEPVPTPAPTPAVTPAAVQTATPAPAATAEPAADVYSDSRVLRVMKEVPELKGIIRAGQGEMLIADGTYEVEGMTCSYIGLGTDTAEEPVRIFAVPEDLSVVYEYHAGRDAWYRQYSWKVYYDDPEDLRTYSRTHSGAGAVAYIGSYTGDDLPGFAAASDMGEALTFLGDIPQEQTVVSSGSDVFLFVPEDTSMGVEVLQTEGTQKQIKYYSESGLPVLITADENTEIGLYNGEARECSFTLAVTEDDFKQPSTGKTLINVSYLAHQEPGPFQLDAILAQPDMKEPLQNGIEPANDLIHHEVINYYECWVVPFGKDQGGHITPEKWFALSMDGEHVFAYDVANDVWNER